MLKVLAKFRGRGNHISAAKSSPLITLDSARKEDLLPEACCKGPCILRMLLMRRMLDVRGLRKLLLTSLRTAGLTACF